MKPCILATHSTRSVLSVEAAAVGERGKAGSERMSEKRTRDQNGRWLKGVSGNPKGRPVEYARIDHGDLQEFKNTIIEVNTPDGSIVMTREAAVLHRLYQSAMKGNVHAQIFLSRRFEKHHETKALIAAKLSSLIEELEETGRAPTEREAALIEAARGSLGYIPRPDPQETKIPMREIRRRKP